MWVEKDPERDGDDSQASEDPPNIPHESFEIPAALPQSPEPRVYVARKLCRGAPEVRAHDDDEEHKKFVQAELEATADLTKVNDISDSNHNQVL